MQSIRSEGGHAAAETTDVTDTKSVRQAFEFATSEFGVVDIVSNNAGAADAKLALDADDTGWNRVMETNVHGFRRVAVEAAARLVAAGKSGSIVNTASILGLRVSTAQSSFAGRPFFCFRVGMPANFPRNRENGRDFSEARFADSSLHGK